MSEYLEVPVHAARKIASRFEKQVVVIVALDKVKGMIHTTTFGTEARYKIEAAELGPVLAKAAGAFEPASKPFEDFREAAQSAERFDRLLKHVTEVRAFLAKASDALRISDTAPNLNREIEQFLESGVPA